MLALKQKNIIGNKLNEKHIHMCRTLCVVEEAHAHFAIPFVFIVQNEALWIDETAGTRIPRLTFNFSRNLKTIGIDTHTTDKSLKNLKRGSVKVRLGISRSYRRMNLVKSFLLSLMSDCVGVMISMCLLIDCIHHV